MATRQQKYPETATFHYYNANPKGRITGDCTIRAVGLATGIGWEQAARDLTEFMISTGYYDSRPAYTTRWLEKYGFKKHPQPKHSDGTKLTVGELAKKLKNEPNPVIVTMSKHMTCIINGKVQDIWDCTERCVGNYWTKE